MTRGAGRMANRDSCSWLNAIHYPTPEQNLLAAVVKSAARDVRRGCDADRATARAYLFGPNFEIDAAVLNDWRAALIIGRKPGPAAGDSGGGQTASGLPTAAELAAWRKAQSKADKDRLARAIKQPVLSDLRESGQLEENAYAVMFIHRPAYYDTTADETAAQVIIAKNRDGQTGAVDIYWNPGRAMYVNAARPINL